MWISDCKKGEAVLTKPFRHSAPWRKTSNSITVTAKATGKSAPTLNGPFVQGPPAERFVYLDIGTYAGQTDTQWSRRLKVPLAGITAKMVEQVSGSAVLEASVPGTGRDGGPNCATVKDFSGWSLKRS